MTTETDNVAAESESLTADRQLPTSSGAPTPQPVPPRPSRLKKIAIMLASPVIGFLVIAGAWEAVIAIFQIPPYLLPTPIEIAKSFDGKWAEIGEHTWVTFKTAFVGYLIGNVFALLMAAFMAEFPTFERTAYPWMLALRAIPVVALAPLLLIWLGFNTWPIIITSALICFFPTLVNAIDGFKAADPTTLELMRGLNASRFEAFRVVKFRTALPYLFAAFKISVVSALIGAVVGEWISSDKGLGYITVLASRYVDTLMLFRAIVAVTVLALVWFGIVFAIERWALRWQRVGR